MGIPAFDIALSKKPVALLITGANEIKPIAIKKTMSGYFVDKEYGVFMTDPTKALKWDKNAVYFYDIRSAKPLNMLALKEVQEFVNDNGLSEISPRELRQGDRLRRLFKKNNDNQTLALKELHDEEFQAQEQIRNEIDYINKSLLKKSSEVAQDQHSLQIHPDDYAGYVVEQLIGKGLITRGEATSIRFNLSTGEITIDDFVKQLETLHKIEVHKPITANAQYFIEHYRTFEPGNVMSYIKGAKGVGKDIKELGQPIIRNLVPIFWIIGAAVAVSILAIVLTSVDWDMVKNLIPFLNK